MSKNSLALVLLFFISLALIIGYSLYGKPSAGLNEPPLLPKTASLSGHLDRSHPRSRRVILSLGEEGGGFSFHTTTDSNGKFYFDSLPIGPGVLFLENPESSNFPFGGDNTLTLPSANLLLGKVNLSLGSNNVAFDTTTKSNDLIIRVQVDGKPQKGTVIFARNMTEQHQLEKEYISDSNGDRQFKLKSVVAATTNSMGSADFGTHFLGSWTFLASVDNRSWTWVYPYILNFDEHDSSIIFDITTLPGKINVRDGVTQQPVRERELHFYSNYTEPGFRIWTDDEGVIETVLPPGTYYVEFYPRDLKNVRRMDWFNENNNQEIVLY